MDVLIERPDGSVCADPKEIFVRKNSRTEILFARLEEEREKFCRKMRNKIQIYQYYDSTEIQSVKAAARHLSQCEKREISGSYGEGLDANQQ